MLRPRFLILLAASLMGGCDGSAPSSAVGRDDLQLSEARVRALIPGQDKTAGYFTARNTGTAPVVLVGAHTDAARTVEMHTTEREGDMVRMRRLAEIVIPPGETVRFAPGGRHLMLFGVEALGETAEIVLERQDGTETPVRFRVEKINGGGG